jgi:hypothetical protein
MAARFGAARACADLCACGPVCACGMRPGRVQSNARKGLATTRATPWRQCVVTAHGKAVAGSRHGGGRTMAVQARREARAAKSGGGPAHARAPGVPGPCVPVAHAGRRRLGPTTWHGGVRQGDGGRQGQVERLGSDEEQG